MILLKKTGFTLAETLITLVIIGIIAALTVPVMITKYQKEQTVTKLKKAYSTLAQTTSRAIADNGPIKTWEIGTTSSEENLRIFFEQYIRPYISVMGEGTTYEQGGWNRKHYRLNGNSINNSANDIRYYLNDGTSLTIEQITNNETRIRIKIDIDINGEKKPNQVGKDIFGVFYYTYYPERPNVVGKFVPDGGWLPYEYLSSEEQPDSCLKGHTGYWCFAKIMADSWQIKDDYPW